MWPNVNPWSSLGSGTGYIYNETVTELTYISEHNRKYLSYRCTSIAFSDGSKCDVDIS